MDYCGFGIVCFYAIDPCDGVLCHLVYEARSREAFRADDQSQYASANGAV